MPSENVLIIDDDYVVLDLLQHILDEFISGKIIAFSSSILAYDFIQEMRIGDVSLVICDLQMPDYGGIEILTQFRNKDTATPFLMLTASATKEAVIMAKKAGATDFLVKPIRNLSFTQKVQTYLN